MQMSIYYIDIHTLHVHYVHAAANLNSEYSKYMKVVHMQYFGTIILQTSYALVSIEYDAFTGP